MEINPVRLRALTMLLLAGLVSKPLSGGHHYQQITPLQSRRLTLAGKGMLRSHVVHGDVQAQSRHKLGQGKMHRRFLMTLAR